MPFPFLPPALDSLRPLFSPSSIEILLLAGQAKYSERPLQVGYVGTGINREFLQSLFLRNAVIQQLSTIQHPALLNHTAIQPLQDATVLLTDTPALLTPFLRIRTDMHVPAWIRQEIIFGRGTEARLWPRSTEREIARHQRRQHYEIDITGESKALMDFFRLLYKPYVASRFGAQAILASEQSFMRSTKGQRLARVYANGAWVGGMLLVERRRTLRFGWFGAISNPPPAGASEVLDGFCIRHAQAQGLKGVILGNSRPNMNDGVVRYKAKFGARIAPTLFPQARLGIQIRQWNDDVVECLRTQPLITQTAGQCYTYGVQVTGNAPATLTKHPINTGDDW